ncbi:RCC1 domain-containing protein [Bdellovibrio sp. HCB-110]|uniref:RCC1 domain-containing protein n=1 Tax=Bdellovibrio sp. HCB-110 TaxID=3391182 RepID=UPI0039B3C187
MIFSDDNTPSISLKLNSGSNYIGTTSLPVSIEASQELSEMSLSISTSCIGVWETYQSSKTLTLPNIEGEHTVSVRVRNKDGFESACTKSKIMMDKSAPIISGSLTLKNSRSLQTQSATLNLPTITDNLSGVAKYEIKLLKTAGNVVIKDWAVKSADALYFNDVNLPDVETDSYYYVIRATDKVGNISEEKTSPAFIVGPILTVTDPDPYNVQQSMGYVSVSLSRAAGADITVSSKSISNSAIAGIDFVYPDVIPSSTVIPSGSTTGKIYFSILSKYQNGPNKNFDIEVTDATNAVAVNQKATVDLVNTELVVPTTVATGYKGVTAARGHVCGLKTDNTMECWGTSLYDNGATVSKLNPSPISGLSNIASVGRGMSPHTCVLDSANDLYCFGTNPNGELGTGDTTSRNVPFKHPTLSNLKKVMTMEGVTCVIESNDQVRCWGYGKNYRLGGTVGTSTVYTPTAIHSFTKALDIAGGLDTMCALDETSPGTREVTCWGDIDYTTTGTKTYISGLPNNVTQISVGTSYRDSTSHGCALTESGKVYCWGSHTYTKRGTSNTSLNWINANEVVVGTALAVKVIASAENSCALLDNGELWCWGGGLPQGTNLVESAIPMKVALGESAIDFSLTDNTGCAVTSTSKIKCWGMNIFGEIGNGYSGNSYFAVALNPAGSTEKFIQVVNGANSTCALKENKTVVCWGANSLGQIGNGTKNPVTRMGYQLPISNISKLVGGLSHYCALSGSGAMYCWGYNGAGQIGNNETTLTTSFRNTPYEIPATYPAGTPGLPAIKDISAASHTTCAITTTGTAKCWGNNAYRQSGFSGLSRSYPTDIPLSSVEKIANGDANTCAVTVGAGTKSIYCWGLGSGGLVGSSETTTPTPVLIETITTTKNIDIFVGQYAACYIHDGTTKCWGTRSAYKVLPLSSVAADTKVYTPTTVPELAGATTMTLGLFDGCAAMPEGIKCWGINNSGYTTLATLFNDPTTIYAFQFGVVKNLSVSNQPDANIGRHICAISSLGDLKCWGTNLFGETHDEFVVRTPSYVLK